MVRVEMMNGTSSRLNEWRVYVELEKNHVGTS